MSIKVTVSMSPLVPRGEDAARKAARAVFAELFGRYQDALGRKAWQWPRQTLRRGFGGGVKEVAGSPRNIVDTGLLRASGGYQFIGDFACQYQWTQPYAKAIHDGAVLRNGGIIPARPWTSAVNGTYTGSAIPPYPMTERMESVFLRYFLQ